MPRYFFDTIDGGEIIRDDVGLIFNTAEAVRSAAISALPEMAADALPDGRARDLTVEVRNEAGERIFRATLNFRSDWLTPPSNDR